jgi:hypothetical protein
VQNQENTTTESVGLPQCHEHPYPPTGARPSHTAAITHAKAAEYVSRAAATIRRQMSALPTEARWLRTSATDFNVTAGLSRFPEIQSAMFSIADGYERLARLAEDHSARYRHRRVRNERD